jgi:hypothetical protein
MDETQQVDKMLFPCRPIHTAQGLLNAVKNSAAWSSEHAARAEDVIQYFASAENPNPSLVYAVIKKVYHDLQLERPRPNAEGVSNRAASHEYQMHQTFLANKQELQAGARSDTDGPGHGRPEKRRRRT